jgi:hypothetical protein
MQHGGDSGRDRNPSPTPPPGSPPPNPQPPHDSPYAHCLPVSDWAGQGWASSAHTANDTFDLRADARQLRLSADALSGVARFRARAGPADASVQLYARVRHRDKSVLDRIEACLRPNGTGIDFRVRRSVRPVRAHSSLTHVHQANPEDPKSGDIAQLELDVVFPVPADDAAVPRAFGALRTDFALLLTSIGTLDALRFDDVFLESAVGSVRVEVRRSAPLSTAIPLT